MSNQEISVSKLVHKREDVYFALTALFGISMYAMLIITIIGIPFIALIFLLSLFVHLLSTAFIRRNGVKLSENQFPKIHEKAVTLAKKMGIKKIPSIYISESSGILNTFATRFFGKKQGRDLL